VWVVSPQACRERGACEGAKEGCVNRYGCFAKALAQDRDLDLRPPAIGLARPEPTAPGSTYFVILMLAGVAYDSLLATPLWPEIVRLTP
jgi:hypothetical protein